MRQYFKSLNPSNSNEFWTMTKILLKKKKKTPPSILISEDNIASKDDSVKIRVLEVS